MIGRTFLAVAFLLVLAGCATPPAPEPEKPVPEPAEAKLLLTEVAFADVPGWAEDRPLEALPAFLRSCAVFEKVPERRWQAGGLEGSFVDFLPACSAGRRLAEGDEAGARRLFQAYFRPFAARAGTEENGLFTGYFEPELRGSRTRTGPYRYPLYRRPADLVEVDLGAFREGLEGQRIAGVVKSGRLQPYADREAIDRGALAGRGLEIVWVDDPVDAFFLHIQGSGRVRLPNGRILRVGYDGQNGHVYRAIGRDLIEQGAMTKDEVSLQSIRDWLRANPDQADAMMWRNASYIFFREAKGEGPVGAQGVALTPGRSMAVDRRHVPLGLPIFIDVEDPADTADRIRRLVVAQDVGGAITGPVRGDLFFGPGDEAERLAGRMRSSGRYWLLLPRTVAPAS